MPALTRPDMYAGPQGNRTHEEWQADAVLVLNDGSPGVDMDTNKMVVMLAAPFAIYQAISG